MENLHDQRQEEENNTAGEITEQAGSTVQYSTKAAVTHKNKEIQKQKERQLQQKRRYRSHQRTYHAQRKKEEELKVAARIGQALSDTAKKLVQAVRTGKNGFMILAVLLLFLLFLSAGFSSCMAVFTDTVSTMMFASWLSDPVQIDAAELLLTEMEVDLQMEIDRIEDEYPDYDEYRYNLDEIGHDPFELIHYLSAIYTEFSYGEAAAAVEQLFAEMYELTTKEVIEQRTRTEIQEVEDPETGEVTEQEVEVTYDYYILEVRLDSHELSGGIAGRMDAEQQELYSAYQESHGGLQQLASPLNLDWYSLVSSYYGYRYDSESKQRQLHRGLDIAAMEGETVYAGQDGIVTMAGYHDDYGNYVVIEDTDGLVSKYAHLSNLSVSAGQTVEKGDQIGVTGGTGSSTGSHLHIELLYEGEYYNPLFYFDIGSGSLYGDAGGSNPSGGNVQVQPPESYSDETIQRLMTEADRYMGMPYTFGGTPPYSFDCSAYVCWVYSNSGAYDLPRTTAQGIYDQCAQVSPDEARAGDLIFFTGTYNAGRPVTHVGIYCGNGVMAHCGDPIQYTSIHTAYWQSHFYGYGRLLY